PGLVRFCHVHGGAEVYERGLHLVAWSVLEGDPAVRLPLRVRPNEGGMIEPTLAYRHFPDVQDKVGIEDEVLCVRDLQIVAENVADSIDERGRIPDMLETHPIH